MPYLARSCEPSVKRLLGMFPAVAVVGPRQSGKTTLVKRLMPDAPFFDLDTVEDLERVRRDPDTFLREHDGRPIVIDEAQALPELFRALRVAIDKRRDETGRFLLSGSSSPAFLRETADSLPGRMAVFRIDPLNVFESWGIPPSDLPSMVREKRPSLPKKPRLAPHQVETSFLLGGFPEPFLKGREDSSFWTQWMAQYRISQMERDIRRYFPRLNFQKFQRLMEALSHTNRNVINHSRLARALEVSVPTVKSWIHIAEGTYLWRRTGSHSPKVEKRIVKAPKGHVIDSGLANFLTRIRDRETLRAHPEVGPHWEAFVIEQVLRTFNDTLETVEATHYRTINDTEIGLVIEGGFGTVPIEVKRGARGGVAVLSKFVKDNGLPFGILVNNASQACWLNQQVAQIPFAWL